MDCIWPACSLLGDDGGLVPPELEEDQERINLDMVRSGGCKIRCEGRVRGSLRSRRHRRMYHSYTLRQQRVDATRTESVAYKHSAKGWLGLVAGKYYERGGSRATKSYFVDMKLLMSGPLWRPVYTKCPERQWNRHLRNRDQ